MTMFMDVHTGMKGITQAELEQAHKEDQKFEKAEHVHFIEAWADPISGKAFCLSEGPNREAVMRVHEKAGHPASEIYELPIKVT